MLQLFKGIDFRRRLTITNEAGARVDLTGKPVDVQIRRHSGDAPLVSLGVGTGVTLLTQSGATLGQADFEVDGAATTAWIAASHQIAVLVDDQVALAPTKLPVRDL